MRNRIPLRFTQRSVDWIVPHIPDETVHALSCSERDVWGSPVQRHRTVCRIRISLAYSVVSFGLERRIGREHGISARIPANHFSRSVENLELHIARVRCCLLYTSDA